MDQKLAKIVEILSWNVPVSDFGAASGSFSIYDANCVNTAMTLNVCQFHTNCSSEQSC